ncbi:MAG: GspE/PulE family protein, partial [Nitriliruptoraceae bacterium]
MAPEQRFKNEWLVRLVKALPQFPVEFIEQARASRSPYLAQAIVAAGLLQPEEIGRIVEQAYRIHYLAPSRQEIDKATLRLVPERLCRTHMLLPVGASDRSIDVAMANPLDPDAQQDVGNVTGRAVKAFYCPPGRVDELLARVLTPDHVIYDLLERVEQRDRVEVVDEPADDRDGATEPVRDPVVQLVDAILARAVQMRASDIHIEQEERQTNVRYRVDGLLRNSMVLPRYVGVGPVVSRIKIIAKLDVADRRHPQDGRANIRVGQAEVGLRVSTLPTALGEKVVIRILDERTAFIPLAKLGFNDTLRVRLEGLMQRSQGILLVTGPTGSGKTSTLYAIASALLSEDTNIVTVEDPIEFRLKGVNQVQVNDKAGLTFASVLRSVLRQDPDIILVGEIRDRETADIACQAALTGHLVLSTLHTNDALGSVTRLVDMGVDRYKIAAGVIGVAAQRLARRLCPECRQGLPADQIPDRLRRAMSRRSIAARAFGPHGCDACDYTGYRGRVPLFELLEITPAVAEAIGEGAPMGDVRLRALHDGALHLLTDDALAHVAAGDITIDEATPHLQLEHAPPASTAASSRAQAGPAPAAARVLVALADESART